MPMHMSSVVHYHYGTTHLTRPVAMRTDASQLVAGGMRHSSGSNLPVWKSIPCED